jgi:RNA polymerase sigma-70 factor (ECF subfamily)
MPADLSRLPFRVHHVEGGKMARSEKDPAKPCAGDRQFEESWRATHRVLYRRALRLTRGDQDRADDLLSVTAVKSLQILRRLPEHIRDPQGFLFLVLRHAHLDMVRRKAREKWIFDEEATRRREEEGEELPEAASGTTRTPLDAILIAERMEDLARALDRLKPRQRALFKLVFLQERAYPEVAQTLGISAPLARKRVQLLRERLRMLTKSSQT